MTVVLIMYILQQCYNCCTKYVIYHVYIRHLKKYMAHFCWYIYNCNYTKYRYIFNIKTMNVFNIFFL